jgi:hypothetical protein
MKAQRGQATGAKINTAVGRRRIGAQPRHGDIDGRGSFGCKVSVSAGRSRPWTLLSHAPWGKLRPLLQFADRPFRGLIGVAGIARVWNFQRIRQYWRYEFERMTSDIDVGNLGFNFRHVATDTLAAFAVRCMMGVLLESFCVGTVIGACEVTGETKLVQSHRFPQIGIVAGAMNIVAVVTRDSARIHQALDEIISLHPVLVRSAVAVMSKCRRSERVFFEFPVIT